MDNDKMILAKIDDKLRQCSYENRLCSTAFLDMRERSLAQDHFKNTKDVKLIFWGGYDSAERTAGFLVPDYLHISRQEHLIKYFDEERDENSLCIVRVKKDKFSTVNHRDYLGSLMALGVKREMLGDILVNDQGCDIILLKSIALYLTENLKSAGRATLECEILDISELNVELSSGDDEKINVSSLRLDNIIKTAYNLSRTSAVEAIESGVVYLNGMQTYKVDKRVSQGDKIVLRGKGKIVLGEIIGTSKKGRQIVAIKTFK